jgi:hypothetical protein
MALDATVGGTTSNTYCDQAWADAYHVNRTFNPEWAALTAQQKESVLIFAQRILSQQLYLGYRVTYTQSLRWPRNNLFDRDGWFISYLVVPDFIKDAQAELALYLIREDRTLDQGSTAIDKVVIGTIAIDFSQSRYTKALPDAVFDMIGFTLQGGGSSVFTKVVRT